MPIPVPQGVKVNIKGNEVTVEGSKGTLVRLFHRDISIALKDGNLIVARPTDNRNHRALHGLTRSLLANMVEGVTKGFENVVGGETAAQIRAIRPVDSYKGKGVKYAGEKLRLKPGKAGKATLKG